MALDSHEYDYVRDLVRTRSAIQLDASKDYLIDTRLARLAHTENYSSVNELVAQARRDAAVSKRLVEAMTTNETSWMRDAHPFEALRDHMLPDLIEARRSTRRLSIWSMACSSGQEPYSISMVMRDAFPELSTWNVRILGTDLSTEMVARSKAGSYSQLETNRGMPARFLTRFMTRQGTQFVVNDEARKGVEFRQMNLVETWPTLGQMDVVFLRNVLIYFDAETRRRIFAHLRRVMAPDGWLVLGGAETALNVDDHFERVNLGRSAAYRLRSPR